MTSRLPVSSQDSYLFREGTHARLFDWLGAHVEADAVRFAVWAPNAEAVSVIGDWNGWVPGVDVLVPSGADDGVWQGRVTGAQAGQAYKYRIWGRHGYVGDKADPMATSAEPPPATASRICAPTHTWGDDAWMDARRERDSKRAPMSIYELHAGSWQRNDDAFLNYRELAHRIADYALDLGFTHVELMPLTEHPFYGSWGYQTTGYFAPTARYGSPEDLMYFVDHLHQRGLSVILDWVPSHFPTDAHGLQYFDGTHLYEHADPRQGFHPEWNSSIFNFGRHEVTSFLLSSATWWLETYHFDGLRVDGVASMLYLDYARKQGEWIPNRYGGRENLEAVAFVQALNEAVHRDHPGVVMIAEESTAWPRVTGPSADGGLGFDMKWNMGWMHDSLRYFEEDPIHRRHHQNELTFSMVYAFSEQFVLPLSHDEVVYGKGSLLGKMPGDAWQQFANLRALYGYMWGHPGKKLLFMGGEFAQGPEWAHEGQLHWHQLELSAHQGIQRWMRELNRLHREEPALHELDGDAAGFEWIANDDANASVLAFLRKGTGDALPMLVVCNFTPVPREGYRVGVPRDGFWRERLNSDADVYGGAGWGNLGGLVADPIGAHGHAHSLRLTLPPLSTIFLSPAP